MLLRIRQSFQRQLFPYVLQRLGPEAAVCACQLVRDGIRSEIDRIRHQKAMHLSSHDFGTLNGQDNEPARGHKPLGGDASDFILDSCA